MLALAAPQAERATSQGKPVKLEIPPRPARPDPKAAKAPDGKADGAPVTVTRDPNRTVRQVEPTFIEQR